MTLLKQLFSEYYKRATFPITSIEAREFGVGFEKKIERRHMSFFTEAELKSYLLHEAPMYISHSTARYSKPTAPMEEKGWLGSDLVFDMDAEEANKEAVAKVLQNTLELRDLLKTEFGAKNMLMVFSGNRGFHIHVRDEQFQQLRSDERKRIVEYLKGDGFDYTLLFQEKDGGMITGPRPIDPGYRGRFAKKAIEIAKENPKKLYRIMSREQADNFIRGVEQGIWSRLPVKDIIERMSVVAGALSMHAIAADGAVTYDISKLIRMPNSLHGSTGFRVMPLSNPDKFEIDRAFAFSDEPINIRFLEDVDKIQILDADIKAKNGEERKVPLYLAVLLACQHKAIIS
jgi:DNA primase small subunit